MSMPPPDPPAGPPSSNADERWMFIRDVIVFEIKLILDNFRDFLLVPASLIAAGIDLVFKGSREGERFYKVLEWGRHSEAVIDVYSCIEAQEGTGHGMKQDYTVDAVIKRLESAIVREYEKGGTAANVKSAVDRAIDQLQREAGGRQAKAKEAVTRAVEKLNNRLDKETPKG
jgi:hypothetical protein